jgi:hypothetical protein
MELVFDHNMKPICKNCMDVLQQKNHNQIKHEYKKKLQEIEDIKQRHPEVVDE